MNQVVNEKWVILYFGRIFVWNCPRHKYFVMALKNLFVTQCYMWVCVMRVERSVLQTSYININIILMVNAANVHWNSSLRQEPLRADHNKDCHMGKALTFVTVTKIRRWLAMIVCMFLSCFFSKSTPTLFARFYALSLSVKCLQRANKVLVFWYSCNENKQTKPKTSFRYVIFSFNI